MTVRPEITVEDPWERFRRLPSEYAHPSRLAELFGGAVDEEIASGLAKQERITARLSACLDRKLALPDLAAPLDQRDRALALASAKRLAALARQAGAVCWAAAVAREIHADRVAALREAIGEDAYTAALGHRAEAIAVEPPQETEALVAAIDADGEGCLEAWIRSQNEGVAARVRLRWPADRQVVEPRDEVREAGPRIMRALAS